MTSLKMKVAKATLAIIALCCIQTAAFAQGNISLYKGSRTHNAKSAWNGTWIGAGMGAGAVVHELDDDIYGKVNGIGGEGGLLSVGFGYDHLVGNRFLIGAFADIDFSNISSEVNYNGLHFEADLTYSLSVGGRLGYLFTPSTMLYGLAAYTHTEFDTHGSITSGSVTYTASGKDEFSGFSLGSGIEAKISQNMFIRSEYRYTHLDEEFSISPSIHTGRVMLSYKVN